MLVAVLGLVSSAAFVDSAIVSLVVLLVGVCGGSVGLSGCVGIIQEPLVGGR